MKDSGYTYDYFIGSFDEAKKIASLLINETDDSVLVRKPLKDKWSMAEILSHLVITGHNYKRPIDKAFDRPEEKLKKGNEPFTPNFAFKWFIRQVSPEYRGKNPTVPSFVPLSHSELDVNEVLSDFLRLQNNFIHKIKRAKLEGLDMDRIKVRNPIIKIIPMSLTACFGVLEAHQRRHFDQMRNLKEQFD